MVKPSQQGKILRVMQKTENNGRRADSNPSPGHVLGIEDDWEKLPQLFTLFSLSIC